MAANPFDQFDNAPAAAAPAVAAPAAVAPAANATALPPAAAVVQSGGAALPVPQLTAPAAAPAAKGAPSGNPFDRFDNAAPPSTSWGRAAGLDARSLLAGAAGLAGAVGTGYEDMADVATGNPAAVAGAKPYQGPRLSDFVHPERWQQAAEYFADKAGLPAPRTAGEKESSAIVSALPSAVLSPEVPIAGMVSAGASGGASEYVRQQGGSPTEQVLAGLAAGGAPTIAAGAAGLARGVVRGGAGSGAAVRQVIDDFAQHGMTPTVGQATGGRVLTGVERMVSATPGGEGVMEHAAAAQRDALSNHVDQIVQNLTGRSDLSPTTAGQAIQSGLKGAAKQAKADAGAVYDKVDQLVPPSTPVAPTRLGATLERLTKPAPGAENLSEQLVSPTIKAYKAAFDRDTSADAAQAAAPEAAAPTPETASAAEPPARTPGSMPYSTLSALKAQLGGKINWSPFATDPENGALKQLWQAVRGDMNDAASGISPEAKQAVDDANSTYTALRGKQKILEGVLNKQGGPEAVYNSLINSGKQGATKIRAVLSAVDEPTRRLIAGSVIKRLGQATPGLQNAAGDVFSADTFLTNWNRLSPEARDALFSQLPDNYSKNLTQLAKNIERLKASGRVLSNPSGTARAWGHNLWLADLLSSVPMMLVSPHVAAGELASGLGVAGGAWGAAKILTSPRAVRWPASETTIPRSLPPALAAAFARNRQQSGAAQ
jgi:hypothetical protein